MKFHLGDDTDKAFRIALQHELMRCHDAFEEFFLAAGAQITLGDSRTRAYRAYNTYSRFIHHLYEFLIGAITWRRCDTRQVSGEEAQREIQREAERALWSRRDLILKGCPDPKGNDLSAYAEDVPADFAQDFRRHRNVTLGHVLPQRRSLNLSLFYADYHQFLVMIYEDAQFAWLPDGECPDLDEITAFSTMLAVRHPARSAGLPTSQPPLPLI